MMAGLPRFALGSPSLGLLRHLPPMRLWPRALMLPSGLPWLPCVESGLAVAGALLPSRATAGSEALRGSTNALADRAIAAEGDPSGGDANPGVRDPPSEPRMLVDGGDACETTLNPASKVSIAGRVGKGTSGLSVSRAGSGHQRPRSCLLGSFGSSRTTRKSTEVFTVVASTFIARFL
jgi:hypothetical protein